MLVAIQDPEIQLALNRFRNPTHKLTQHSELAYPWETLLDSWIYFIEWSWLYDGLSHVDSLHLT